MGSGPCAKARGHETQIRMDDCTKEPPAGGRRTRYVAPKNFAGVKGNPVPGTFREVDVTLQKRRHTNTEISPEDYRRRISVQRESFFT